MRLIILTILKSRPKAILNNAGASLPELLTAMGMASFAILLSMTIIHITQTYAIQARHETEALRMSLLMEYNIRKHVSLAVRVRPEGTQNVAAGEGYIAADLDCSSFVTCPMDTWQEVAAFQREYNTGGLDPANPERGLARTWFWYKPGRHNPGNITDSTPGMFVIDTGANGSNGSPDNRDLYFSHMSEFAIQSFSTDLTAGIGQIQVRGRFRYHGITQVRSWCSSIDIGAGRCNYNNGQQANYLDKEASFNVLLVNNLVGPDLGDGSGLEVRPLGPIHFFRKINPASIF